MISSSLKVLTLEDVCIWSSAWKRAGLKVGFTNGCFDILHIGHVALLDFTQGHCDRLIVGLNSDDSVRRLKGDKRPINIQDERAMMVASMSMVNSVVIFDEDTPRRLIELLDPDVLVKGADYKVSDIVGSDIVLSRGGKVIRCPIVASRSSSRTIARIA